jgi:magnesium chelatase family protein
MAIKIITAAFIGIEGKLITVEVDIGPGLPCFNIVGLAGTSVKESKERVRSAIVNSGYKFPICRIIINLAPADLKKAGTHFDLPIAIGILIGSNQLYFNDCLQYLFIGELSLSGDLNKIPGALPIAIEGKLNRIVNFIIPMHNEIECSFVKDINIFPFESLKHVINYIKNRNLSPYKYKNINSTICFDSDYNEIIGQESSKRSLEVAAAGGHNLLMFGPTGSGKTMFAQRIPTILPPLNYEEALEVTKIYSVSGNIGNCSELIKKRPFRSPHHTSSAIALIGGGNNLMPGEISLAHNGVLFLDEVLEFKRNVLEVLRQPLEERKISISRASGTVVYPANIMLIASMNPCQCGRKNCTCSDYEKNRYISRLSGPFLDRIDVFTYVNSVPYNEIKYKGNGESSKAIKERVKLARAVQEKRYASSGIMLNSQMDTKLIKKYCKLNSRAVNLMESIYNRYHISTRSYSRILKISRTISDLNGREEIALADIIEALQYRKYINEEIV